MSFNALESSVDAGAPIDLFKFAVGGQSFLYTSADLAQTVLGELYTPEPIQRGAIELDGESLKGSIEVTIPRTNPVAAFFVGFIPEPPMTLTILSKHRSDAELTRSSWEVATGRFQGATCRLTCVPTDASLRRKIPRNGFQAQCNWALYGPQCGISKDLFKVVGVVTVISGSTIQGTNFSSKPDGWFNNGYVEAASGERRWIVDHAGATLTLMSPFLGVAVNDTVTAFAGCDRTEAVCASKFSNLVNHLGWARVPSRNPFGSGLT